MAGCLNNLRQLSQALGQFAEDHDGWFPKNPDDGAPSNWIGGGAGIGSVQEFNPKLTAKPETSALAGYLGPRPDGFRCPADTRSGGCRHPHRCEKAGAGGQTALHPQRPTRCRMNPWHVSAEDFPADGYASDQLEFLLHYAVLAPSNHNTQPWLFRIGVADLAVYADRRRALRVVDPLDRELTLSVGAVVFNLRVTAEYFGHHYQVELHPDPADPNLLARFHLGLRADTGAEDVLLFHALQRRHTNRQPFLPDPLPAELLARLQEVAAREGAWLVVFEDEARRQAAADLVAQAERLQWANPQFRRELAQWVRSKPGAADGLPVHDFGVQDWLAFAGPAIIRTFNRGDGQAARDRELATHSPVLAVLGTEQDTPTAWLQAGQALQHVLLAARAEEVWASFLCQPIEVPELRPAVADLAGGTGHPQVLLRLGYGPEVPPAPRRSPREMLIIQRHHGHA